MNIAIALVIVSPYMAVVPALAALYMVVAKKVHISFNPLNIGMFMLFVWAFISGIVNNSVTSTLASFVLLLLLCLAVYLQNVLVDEQKVIELVTKVWKYSALAAVVGIVEKAASYFFDLTWISTFYLRDPITYIYRIYSTFGNPNIAGAWFAVMILVSLYLFESDNYNRKRYFLTYISIFVLALVFTGSRGAVLGLEFSLIAYFFLTKNKTSKTVLMYTFALIIALALLSPEINHSHPLNSRNDIWISSLQYFSQKPIVGWGAFGVLENINKSHSHNIWISIMTMYGSVGLMIFFWIKLYLYKSITLLGKSNMQIFPLVAAVHILIAVHGIFDFIIMSPQGGILFLSSAAIAVSLARCHEPFPSAAVARPVIARSYALYGRFFLDILQKSFRFY